MSGDIYPTGTRAGISKLICFGAVSVLMTLAASFASASEQRFGSRRAVPADQQTRACAAYDLHVMAGIEELEGSAGDAAVAAFQALEARALCRAGRFSEAADLYTRIELHSAERWLK